MEYTAEFFNNYDSLFVLFIIGVFVISTGLGALIAGFFSEGVISEIIAKLIIIAVGFGICALAGFINDNDTTFVSGQLSVVDASVTHVTSNGETFFNNGSKIQKSSLAVGDTAQLICIDHEETACALTNDNLDIVSKNLEQSFNESDSDFGRIKSDTLTITKKE